jgi:hypothetical protein
VTAHCNGLHDLLHEVKTTLDPIERNDNKFAVELKNTKTAVRALEEAYNALARLIDRPGGGPVWGNATESGRVRSRSRAQGGARADRAQARDLAPEQ